MSYDLELEKAKELIKKHKPKITLIQLPDGLKPRAKEIQKALEKETEIIIWCGTCYGACDIPKAKVDLIIQWGHSKWI